MKLLPVILLTFLVGCGSGDETTSLQDIVGLWDVTSEGDNAEDMKISYLAISANGELTDYVYQEDSSEGCYAKINSGVIDDLGDGNFKETDDESQVTYYSIIATSDSLTSNYILDDEIQNVTVNRASLSENEITPLCETAPTEPEPTEPEPTEPENLSLQDIVGTWKDDENDDFDGEYYTVIRSDGTIVEFDYVSSVGNCYGSFEGESSTIELLSDGLFKLTEFEEEDGVYVETDTKNISLSLLDSNLVFNITDEDGTRSVTLLSSNLSENDFTSQLCEE